MHDTKDRRTDYGGLREDEGRSDSDAPSTTPQGTGTANQTQQCTVHSRHSTSPTARPTCRSSWPGPALTISRLREAVVLSRVVCFRAHHRLQVPCLVSLRRSVFRRTITALLFLRHVRYEVRRAPRIVSVGSNINIYEYMMRSALSTAGISGLGLLSCQVAKGSLCCRCVRMQACVCMCAYVYLLHHRPRP